MTNLVVSRTIAFEGCHRCGKSTTVSLLNKSTEFADSHMDRAFASTYAFAKLFNRQPVDLDLAIHDYFVNPRAYLVYFSLGIDDFQADFDAGVTMRERWVGFVPNVDNRALDEHIRFAIDRAKQLGYGGRILVIQAKAFSQEEQCQQILNWLASQQV